MDGKTRNAGARTGVNTVTHPFDCTDPPDGVEALRDGAGGGGYGRGTGLEVLDNDYILRSSRRSSSGHGAPSIDYSSGDNFDTVEVVVLDQTKTWPREAHREGSRTSGSVASSTRRS